MNNFETKLELEKNDIYKNYLKSLKKANISLNKELKNISEASAHDNLTKFISDFYKFKNIDYQKMSEKEIKTREIQNHYKYKHGLNNYSVILFNHFPVDFVKQVIQIFIDNRIYNDIIYTEIKKFLYANWKNETIKDVVDQITNILVETANFTKEEYKDIMTNSSNPRYNFKKHYSYYVFWLYCFYPLIDGYQDLILKLVNIVYLDDAQDELMDGILKINSVELLPFYKKFIITVWKSCNYRYRQCFDLFFSATGAFSQNIDIIKKLKKDLTWDIFSDSELQEFWTHNDNIDLIDRIKEALEK